MKLSDLLQNNQIWIQCHDNPDPDTIASGFGLYSYFNSQGVKVKLFYSGSNRIEKTNLLIMTSSLGIPLEYMSVGAATQGVEGLLITIDCQYGSGNVTHVPCKQVAMIDHHPLEGEPTDLCRVKPELGSCATLVWEMLREVDYPVNTDRKLGTALYYGLYTDTNQFSELFGTEDLDMRDALNVDMKVLQRLKNNNLSLQELEIAGIAMKNYYYEPLHRYAIVKTLPCDSNVLGLIADFLMQVGEIDICVVYNEPEDGIKLSVRSCIKEINANELAAYITDGIGTGGGHYEKAGGFLSKRLYMSKFSSMAPEEFFRICLSEYCESFNIIHTEKYVFPTGKYVKEYVRKNTPVLYVRPDSFLKIGEKVSVRWGNSISEYDIVSDEIWLLERCGLIRRIPRYLFNNSFEDVGEDIPEDYCGDEGLPTVRDWKDGRFYSLAGYTSVCRPKGEQKVKAIRLTKNVKLFPEWDKSKYFTGLAGDYLLMSVSDNRDIYIEPGKNFVINYIPVIESI